MQRGTALPPAQGQFLTFYIIQRLYGTRAIIINNSDGQHLSNTYYVPGTVLSSLCIVTLNSQGNFMQQRLAFSPHEQMKKLKHRKAKGFAQIHEGSELGQ